MLWFLKNQQRFIDEHKAIDRLAETADWLAGISWELDSNGLHLDVIIQAHGYDYPVRMIYPAMYPKLPPIVQPQDSTRRWSSHQYNNGVLCLEWGPDNWHPNITGAQMLESAYRLFDIENPLGSNEQIAAPSRHYLTVGQELQGKFGRFYMGEVLIGYLASLPAESKGTFTFSSHSQQKSLLVIIQGVEPHGADISEDVSIPGGVKTREQKGLFAKTDAASDFLEEMKTSTQICEMLEITGHELSGSDTETSVLIMDSDNKPHFFWIYGDQKENVLKFACVKSDYAHHRTRIPSEFEAITGRRVGIVGLGSVGSKIALSLARTGVKDFLLVDYDIFLPENICRHELNWHDIGEHKVDAINGRFALIAPNINADVSCLHLTGQESNAGVNRVLNALAKCDLLIDATASAGVLNLLATVAAYHQKPLVWMEVYAGGIGGMIARSRPGLDPSPPVMRDAYEEIAAEMNLPELSDAGPYAAANPDETVAIATDADVSVIANHATRLILDTLLNREPSLFPYSMYLIGLAKSDFFKQPFDVRPIATEHLRKEEAIPESELAMLPEAVSLLQEILNKEAHEDSAT